MAFAFLIKAGSDDPTRRDKKTMTADEFNTLTVGDTVVHVRTGRALVVTAVHVGEGRYRQNVVYAVRRQGDRRIVVTAEEFHRLTSPRLAAGEVPR